MAHLFEGTAKYQIWLGKEDLEGQDSPLVSLEMLETASGYPEERDYVS
jgi:hypothetical protein